jgi:hypothetical protein
MDESSKERDREYRGASDMEMRAQRNKDEAAQREMKWADDTEVHNAGGDG